MTTSNSTGYRETSISYDYERQEVEFYTTTKNVFSSILNRNSEPLVCQELNPGYRLVYSMQDVRPPRLCLKVPKKQG